MPKAHPLEPETPEMAERSVKAQSISPPVPPGISPHLRVPAPELEIGKLAGVTDCAPVHTPGGKWNARAGKLLGLFRSVGKVGAIRPYLEDAAALLEAKMATVRESTGRECDPITAMNLSAAARQYAYAAYWSDTADPDTPEGQKVLMLASKFFDSARCGSLQAYANAVAIARSKPVTQGDPLAYLEAVVPKDEPT